MAGKTDAGAPAPAPATPVAEAPVLLTAAEACERIAEQRKAVEALAAFHAEQIAQGHHHDTFEAFRARFDAFMARPIG